MRYCNQFFILALLIPISIDRSIALTNDLGEECYVSDRGEVVCDTVTSLDRIYEEDDTKYDDRLQQVQCNDGHELCAFWAGLGECLKNPNYMLENCRQSCAVCPDNNIIPGQSPSQHAENQRLLKQIELYGIPQKVDDSNYADLTYLTIRQTIDYFENFINAENPTHSIPEHIIKECVNKHELCAFWAAQGECENNPSFMTIQCAPSCRTCSKIDFKTRCPPRDPNAVPALRPGELNHMFERIVATAPGNQTETSQKAAHERRLNDDGIPIYTVTVHSRPSTKIEWSELLTEFTFDSKRDLEEDPWVITLDNFLSDEECDRMIDLGYMEKYERSKDVGARLSDGTYDAKVSTTRTSENAWCSDKGGCRNDEIARRIFERIARLTRIPHVNYEDFQILKYETGQFYRNHHDYIDHQRERQPGPRILTFFLYLSDVEEGGETHLDKVMGGLSIRPKKGRALLWPSVMNYDPMVKDWRTTHAAQDVIVGTKFAANVWIHMYENIEATRIGCA